VLQYREYLYLASEIDRLKTEKLKIIAGLSKANHISISEVAKNENNYPELAQCTSRLSLVERDRDQVSDEMTFANPIIWMMYKDIAYKGAQNEIRDWAAFKDHCAPEDYICGKRFRFLERYLRDKNNLELKTLFPDEMPLPRIYRDRQVADLVEDERFMKAWQENEYLRTDGLVNKWHTKL